jgi:hypothetical protein
MGCTQKPSSNSVFDKYVVVSLICELATVLAGKLDVLCNRKTGRETSVPNCATCCFECSRSAFVQVVVMQA